MVHALLLAWRHVEVTDRRIRQDFASVLVDIADVHFPQQEERSRGQPQHPQAVDALRGGRAGGDRHVAIRRHGVSFASAARASTIRTRTADREGNSAVRERKGRRDRKFAPQRPPTQRSRHQGAKSETPPVHLHLLRSSFVQRLSRAQDRKHTLPSPRAWATASDQMFNVAMTRKVARTSTSRAPPNRCLP